MAINNPVVPSSILLFVWLLSASLFSCTAFTTNKEIPSERSATDQGEQEAQPNLYKQEMELLGDEALQGLAPKKDPCASANAQEAWLALGDSRPALGKLISSEIYFSSVGTKMLAVAQKLLEVYGEDETRSYVEVSAELAERGSRVVSFSQVIATRPEFAEASELFVSLPPYWQQQIQDPQATLAVKHYLLKSGIGFVKLENEIVSDLSMKLEQGQELRCRSGESCLCL
jgi:hypothetical protein